MARASESLGKGTRMDAASVAAGLKKAKRSGAGWLACCPAHDDSSPSLSINDSDKGVLVHCHGGCSQDSVLNAIEGLGLQIRRTRQQPEADVIQPLLNPGSLAAAKGLAIETLEENHVIDGKQRGVGFLYADRTGEIVGTKYRKYLGGGADRGFSWNMGSKPCLFGLWRLERDFANDGRIILCEGETDALTLWQHGYTALALPGANMWKDEWAAEFPEGAKVYVVIEPDQGGRTVEAAIEASPLKSRAWFIRMLEAAKDPNALHTSSQSFPDAFDALIAEAEPVLKPKERRIVLRDITALLADESEPEWLIDDTLEQNVIALMVGARGSLKSFVAIDWMMRAAVEGHGAVALSAEGSGFGRRIQAWTRTFAPRIDPAALHVKSFERSISLCVPDVMRELQEVIGELSWKPRLLVIDTLSKYSAGLDENENSEVRDFLESLSESLRNVFGCAILLVAHTGYAASDRIRGASSFGANTEAEYIVTRPSPTDFVCKVSRERFKDSPPLEPIGYQGEVVDLGRFDKRGRAVTSLILRAGAQLPTAKPQVVGANQRKAITALTEWLRTHPQAQHISTMDIGDILKAQGISRQRKPEVLNSLVNARIISPSVGGFSIDRTAV